MDSRRGGARDRHEQEVPWVSELKTPSTCLTSPGRRRPGAAPGRPNSSSAGGPCSSTVSCCARPHHVHEWHKRVALHQGHRPQGV